MYIPAFEMSRIKEGYYTFSTNLSNTFLEITKATLGKECGSGAGLELAPLAVQASALTIWTTDSTCFSLAIALC